MTTRNTKLPADVLQALANANRAPGWNNRSPDIQRFDVGCALYVVPYRRWAYRRQERMTAEYWAAQPNEGTAA